MQPCRPGFTLLEILIVCFIVGGLAALSLPSMGGRVDSYSVQSAKQQLTATIATARAAAVQKGYGARFHVTGNTISAVVDTSRTDSVFVVPPIDLGAQHGVRVRAYPAAEAGTLRFGSRGFASPRLREIGMYVIDRGARTDTVCVGVLGQVLTRGCTP